MYDEEIIETNGMIINDAIDYISELFAGNSDGHGADHTMRVYHNVHILLEAYPEADSFVVSLAALLHDMADFLEEYYLETGYRYEG